MTIEAVRNLEKRLGDVIHVELEKFSRQHAFVEGRGWLLKDADHHLLFRTSQQMARVAAGICAHLCTERQPISKPRRST
ncbi:MAG: hypothetical protein HY220_00710 [Candidatus Sungbacteria bacterium]|uniref:Uncharacterized protein n=1 Tax=Candidatus Sungiibacteriota bacterium TaxID=2750080 RepID=A0A9D6LT89_9BACT|nr:hypothetical protein [Candidatus Sungbacteria bacterium]